MGKLMRALFILFFPLSVFAESDYFNLNGKEFDQGEVIVIQRKDKSDIPFSISFLGRMHESILFNKKPTVFLGIHYQLRPGMHSITASFEVSPGTSVSRQYAIRVREIFPKLKYIPPKRTETEQKRINEEQQRKITALKELNLSVSSMTYFSWPVLPVKVNSPFGNMRPPACNSRKLRRLLSCRYHLGIDYRSAFDFFHQKPEPARAVNFGRVASITQNLIDGNLIILDHGNGISSEYLHLSKFLVKEGDQVRRGQIIGITGKTGSTEAIHLHLTMKMDYGKTIIDPHKFLQRVAR